MIKFSTLFKTVATNFATANEHDALSHERNRRLWKKAKNWVNHAAAEARRRAEQHARWLKAQAHKRWLKAQAHAAKARKKARRMAAKARKKARRMAAKARKKARRMAAKARKKARQLAATARAFVNKIKNKFGGFNGVLKAFRIVFFFITVMRQHRYHQRLSFVTDFDCSA